MNKYYKLIGLGGDNWSIQHMETNESEQFEFEGNESDAAEYAADLYGINFDEIAF